MCRENPEPEFKMQSHYSVCTVFANFRKRVQILEITYFYTHRSFTNV